MHYGLDHRDGHSRIGEEVLPMNEKSHPKVAFFVAEEEIFRARSQWLAPRQVRAAHVLELPHFGRAAR